MRRAGPWVTSLAAGAVNWSHHVRAWKPPTRHTAAAAAITNAIDARRTARVGSGGGILESAAVTAAPTTSAAPKRSPSRTRVECEAPSPVMPFSAKAMPTTTAAGTPAETRVATPWSQKPDKTSHAATTTHATAMPPRE